MGTGRSTHQQSHNTHTHTHISKHIEHQHQHQRHNDVFRSQSVSPLPPWMPPAFKDRLTTAAPDEVEFVLGRILPDLVSSE